MFYSADYCQYFKNRVFEHVMASMFLVRSRYYHSNNGEYVYDNISKFSLNHWNVILVSYLNYVQCNSFLTLLFILQMAAAKTAFTLITDWNLNWIPCSQLTVDSNIDSIQTTVIVLCCMQNSLLRLSPLTRKILKNLLLVVIILHQSPEDQKLYHNHVVIVMRPLKTFFDSDIGNCLRPHVFPNYLS